MLLIRTAILCDISKVVAVYVGMRSWLRLEEARWKERGTYGAEEDMMVQATATSENVLVCGGAQVENSVAAGRILHLSRVHKFLTLSLLAFACKKLLESRSGFRSDPFSYTAQCQVL